VGGPFIWVPEDADAAMIEDKHREMQSALERVRDVAENWFRVGPEEREKWREEFSR